MTNRPPAAAPAPQLGAFDIGCVVVGGIIGVGIFFTPGRVAARVDSEALVLLAWGCGGLLGLLGALVFAELSTLVPGHGGTFRYLQAAFGRLPAFLYGWANWLVIQAGAAGVVALVLVDHLDQLLYDGRALGDDARVGIAAGVILLFTASNALGLQFGKRVQNTLTVAKVLPLLLLVGLAAVGGGRQAVVAPLPPHADGPLLQLGAAMLPVLFAVGGWQQGSFLAGAARNPRRSVPLGLIGGVAVVVAVYLAVNLGYLGLLGFGGAQHSAAIGADAVRQALGDVGGRVFAAMVVVSAAGFVNTVCMAPPFVLLAMAQQGVFPAAFARVQGQRGTPVLGVLAQGLWAVLLLLSVHALVRSSGRRTFEVLDFLCDGVVFVDWLFFLLCGLALLRLRRQRVAGALRLRGGAVVAAAFALAAAAVVVSALCREPRSAPLVGVGLMALGIPVYLLALRRPQS